MDRTPDWVLTPRRQDFYVQVRPKEPWHVESEEDCERMLCGLFVSVDFATAKISTAGGPLKCPDCWMILERARRTVFQ